jgi:hypothetical protein
VGRLTAQEQAQVDRLKSRDRQVRAHEAAHLAAAGSLALSGASYQMQTGPDGQRYAVGGEVSISLSKGRTAEETVLRARTIQAAALAPADPSGPDRMIAAQAKGMEIEAQAEIARRSQLQSKLASRYQPQDATQNSVFSTVA